MPRASWPSKTLPWPAACSPPRCFRFNPCSWTHGPPKPASRGRGFPKTQCVEGNMPVPLEERSPEETKRLARLAGAVYVSLGLAAAFGFYHAPLVQGDLGTIARRVTQSDIRFRIGVVSDVLSTALSVPLALLLYQLFKPVHKMQAVWMALLLVAAMP